MIRHTLAIVMTTMLALNWTSSHAEDAALSSSQVKQWLKHRIELAHIQNTMKQNPGSYQDLPRAYAQKRQQYLHTQGYSVERFDAHQTRIYNAANAIALTQQTADKGEDADSAPDNCEQRIASNIHNATVPADELEQQLAQMRAMGLPEAQLDAIRKAQASLHDSAEQTARQTCAAQAQGIAVSAAHKQALIKNSRRDWPGVRPWLEQLEHFDQWYAGNDSHPSPPTLE